MHLICNVYTEILTRCVDKWNAYLLKIRRFPELFPIKFFDTKFH